MVENSNDAHVRVGGARKKIAVVAIVAVAALLIAAVASGALLSGGPVLRTDSAASSPATLALVEEYALFKRPEAANVASSLPAYVNAARSGRGGTSQVDYSEAQQVVIAGGQTVWIIPGGGYVCAIEAAPEAGSSGYAAGCATEERVRLEGTMLSSDKTQNGEEIVYGLAPNGDSVATIEFANGTTTTAQVQDNVFSYSGHDGVVGVSLQGSRPIQKPV